MKKYIISIILLCINFQVFSEDYKIEKIAEYPNDKSFVYRRNKQEVEPQDDMTGNSLSIGLDGCIYVYNIDKALLTDISDNKPNLFINFNETKIPRKIIWYNSCFTVEGFNTLIVGYDLNKKIIFNVCVRDLFDDGYACYSYYDEENAIIFFQDSNHNVHCVVHPTMDMQENKRNYHDAAETKALLEDGTYAPHLSLYDDQYLLIDGKITPFGTKWYGNYRYQIYDRYRVYRWDGKLNYFDIEKKEGELIESTVVHPCGDVYSLVYNQKTKLHTLYRIQNTWDTSWRKEWYSTHK